MTLSDQHTELSSDFSTSSTGFVDITGMSITIANRSGGKYIYSYGGSVSNNGTSWTETALTDSSNSIIVEGRYDTAASGYVIGSMQLCDAGDLDGRTRKLRGRSYSSGQTSYWYSNRNEHGVTEVS